MAEPTGIPPIDAANIFAERIELARTSIQGVLNIPGIFPVGITITVTLDQPNADDVKVWIEVPSIPFSGMHSPQIRGLLHIKIPIALLSGVRSYAIAGYFAIAQAGIDLSVAEDGMIDSPVIMYGENSDSITITIGFKEN